MKQSHTERPAGDPSRIRIVELSEDVVGVMTTVLCNSQDTYNNGNHAGKCPENGKCLGFVSNVHEEVFQDLLTSNHGSQRLPRAATALQNNVIARKMR